MKGGQTEYMGKGGEDYGLAMLHAQSSEMFISQVDEALSNLSQTDPAFSRVSAEIIPEVPSNLKCSINLCLFSKLQSQKYGIFLHFVQQ